MTKVVLSFRGAFDVSGAGFEFGRGDAGPRIDDVRRQQPALHVFDPMPFLGDERWCHAIVDQTLLYVDDNHLSRAGSLFFSKRFTW